MIDQMDREIIISLLKRGLPVSEIVKKTDGRYTSSQIAAIKAHRTMKSYTKSSRLRTSRTMDDSARVEIKNLNSKGFSTSEIMAKMGNVYSAQQIRGIKAAISKGQI